MNPWLLAWTIGLCHAVKREKVGKSTGRVEYQEFSFGHGGLSLLLDIQPELSIFSFTKMQCQTIVVLTGKGVGGQTWHWCESFHLHVIILNAELSEHTGGGYGRSYLICMDGTCQPSVQALLEVQPQHMEDTARGAGVENGLPSTLGGSHKGAYPSRCDLPAQRFSSSDILKPGSALELHFWKPFSYRWCWMLWSHSLKDESC